MFARRLIVLGALSVGCGATTSATSATSATSTLSQNKPPSAQSSPRARAPQEAPAASVDPKILDAWRRLSARTDAEGEMAAFVSEPRVMYIGKNGWEPIGRDRLEAYFRRTRTEQNQVKVIGTRIVIAKDIALREGVFQRPDGSIVTSANIRFLNEQDLVSVEYVFPSQMEPFLGGMRTMTAAVPPRMSEKGEPWTIAQGKSAEAENIARTRRLYRAFAQRDERELSATLAPADLAAARAAWGKFATLDVTLTNIWAAEDLVVAHWAISAIRKLPGTDGPDGRPVTLHGLDVLVARGETLGVLASYGSRAELQNQLGKAD